MKHCAVIARMIPSGLLLFFALMGFLVNGTIAPSLAAVMGIDVPVLVNSVSLDGRPTNAKEWSEAGTGNLTLTCYKGSCSRAPVETVPAVLWLKHDDRWLYALIRVTFPRAMSNPPCTGGACPMLYVKYCWSSDGTSPWTACDFGYVGLQDDQAHVEDLWYPEGRFVPNQNDIDNPGGENNVVGTARYDGNYYWFEFRKMLDSNDGYDWKLAIGKSYGIAGLDGQLSLHFGFTESTKWVQDFAVSLCPCEGLTTTLPQVATTVTTSQRIATTSSMTSMPVSPSSLQFFPTPVVGMSVLAVGAISVVAAILVLRRRRTAQQVAAAPSLATGYPDFDDLLAGGLPLNYAVVIISPPCDEKDLLLRRFVHATVSSGSTAFLVTADVNKGRNLAIRYPRNFYAYCAVGEHEHSEPNNVFYIPSIGNLSEFNILLNQSLGANKEESGQGRVIMFDLLTDILLQYKTVTTRKWLTEFIGKRKAAGFTIVATLNPHVAKEEIQAAILDLFDAILEIYEKKLKEKLRRFMTVRKLYGRRYPQTEIMLDLDKLWS